MEVARRSDHGTRTHGEAFALTRAIQELSDGRVSRVGGMLYGSDSPMRFYTRVFAGNKDFSRHYQHGGHIFAYGYFVHESVSTGFVLVPEYCSKYINCRTFLWPVYSVLVAIGSQSAASYPHGSTATEQQESPFFFTVYTRVKLPRQRAAVMEGRGAGSEPACSHPQKSLRVTKSRVGRVGWIPLA